MRHGLLILTTVLAVAAAAAADADASECTTLRQMKLDHAVVTGAVAIPASTAVPLSDRQSLPGAKTAYCRIQVTATPTPDSDIHLELWVPADDHWNGQFEQVGNGGFAGTLPYGVMSNVLSLGFAVAGTDDGHRSAQLIDAAWALDHPEKLKDYGWRAIDVTARLSKRILTQLESKSPGRSYFVGCSDGGREALMMAERFPTYFDGIVAGAPAYAMTRLLTGGALRSAALGGAEGHLPEPALALLQHRALDVCGGGAPYLKDPRQCHVDLSALACTDGGSTACLSAAQIDTARIIYGERKDPADGRTLYAVLPGAEAVDGSWNDWLTGRDDKTPAAGSAFTWNYLAFMVMHDPHLDMRAVTSQDLVRGERTVGPVIDAESADLTAFKAHGGKLIQYHGWNDPGIAPGYSLEYRARVAAKTAGLDDFYRLYMVPGMLHCAGGDAPTQVDWQRAIENWVDKGVPPAELIAADGKGSTQILRPFE